MDHHWLAPLECARSGFGGSPIYQALKAWELRLELQLQRVGCFDVCGSFLDAFLQLACDLRVRPIVLAATVLAWLITITLLLRSITVRLVR